MKEAEPVVLIPHAKLVRHPDEPRKPGAFKKDALKTLIGAMEANGVEPCIVRKLDDDTYQLIAGHRRQAALEIAGEKTVPCIVREYSDAGALKAVLASNELKEDADPFLEARAIKKLLDSEGETLESVATALGWSIRRVARRRELLNLCPTILQEFQREDSELALWPITWFEVIVQLDPVAQEMWFEREAPQHFGSIEEVEQSVLGYLRKLGKAPWDLEDASLVPKAGACSACPKQSASKPGLFGDEGTTADKLNNAVCRDAICWKAKAEKHGARRVAEAVAKDPEIVLLKGGRPGFHTSAADRLAMFSVRAPKGTEVLEEWGWKPCAKDDKGAKKGVIGSGPAAGKVQWFKPSGNTSRYGYATPKEERKKSKREELKEAEAAHDRVMAVAFLQEIAARLDKLKDLPDAEHVAVLSSVFGIPASQWEQISKDALDTRDAIAAGKLSAFLWPGILRQVKSTVQGATGPYGANAKTLRAIAGVIGRTFCTAANLDEIEAEATAAVPVPPALKALREEVAALPQRGGKKPKVTKDPEGGTTTSFDDDPIVEDEDPPTPRKRKKARNAGGPEQQPDGTVHDEPTAEPMCECLHMQDEHANGTGECQVYDDTQEEPQCPCVAFEAKEQP